MHRTISDFATLAHQCAKETTLEGLSALVSSAVRDIGFQWFAALRIVDRLSDERNKVIMLDHPLTLTDDMVSHRLFHETVQIASSAKSFGGICWSKISERVKLTECQLITLMSGSEHGLSSGFTITMSITGDLGSSFTVARSASDEISEYEKVAIRAVATIALEHGQRIDAPIAKTGLTPRQRECTALVAQGKTDWEIGQIIGIGRDTVHEYIEAARRKYDVRTRPQLVLAAFRNGDLHDLDIR